MSIRAKVKKLEEAAGIGERCLNCRVHYIRFGDEIKRTAPEDLYISTCMQCGQTLALIHSGYSERDRAVLIAVSCGEQGDPAKWLASYAWMQHHPRFQEIKDIGEVEEKRLRGQVHSENLRLRESARKQVKVLDEHEAAQAASMAEQQRREKLVKSGRKEAWARPLAMLDKVRERRGEIKDHKLFCYYVMIAMEKFIWGEKSAETMALLNSRKRELAEAEAQRQREIEERERKRLAEKAEREARYEREKQERERQRLERLGLTPPVSGQSIYQGDPVNEVETGYESQQRQKAQSLHPLERIYIEPDHKLK